ncbi:MAG: hypothetical protein ACQEQ2_05800 [Pseudomonadota bacterium]
MQNSVINFSNVKNASKLFRLDAEYFQPKFIEIERKIKENPYSELRDLIEVLTDYHSNGSYEVLKSNVSLSSEPDYAHMIRTTDIERDDFERDIVSISKHAYEFLSKTQMSGGEIIVSKIGNAGKAYLAPPIKRPTSLGMNQFMIRTNQKTNNFYVYCFLAGRYGQNQLSQRVTGALPPSIDKESVRSIFVPLFSESLQTLVEKTVSLHFKLRDRSKIYFNNAEELLSSELKLNNWRPKHQPFFIKNFSDTETACRLDPEYFQPKYDEIIRAIKQNSDDWDLLKNLVDIKKGVEVGSGEYCNSGIPFIRVSNLSPFEISKEKNISEDLYTKLTKDGDADSFSKSRSHQPKQGEILFTKDGSPGIAYFLKDAPPSMIVSGGILRLRRKTDRVNDEYLTLVLNSIVTKEQVKRDVGGSIILHWRPEQVKNTLVPILSTDKQLKIKQMIQEHFILREQSDSLITCAKRALEIAIETDEKNAIAWLDQEYQKIVGG